ncbi:MAG: nucleotidyltransferase [Clostridium sp.]|nr:nucleotidyltransferase [Clostridium sp.]
MNKPVLVVMAAGMGSRYGGPKQIDPVGANGELIIDYSIYDAHKAGFETVVFIIERRMEADFREAIGDRLSKFIDVKYVYQKITDTPKGYITPIERIRPWGTCHAVLAARNLVDTPFAVINADDYYGPEAFKTIYDYLSQHPDQDGCYEYAMVGYQLGNTVTENGTVARGVCETDQDGYLTKVTERTKIEKDGDNARYTEDGGKTWTALPGDTVVSMNLWGFNPSFFTEAWNRFTPFLQDALVYDPLDREYYLPSVVSQLIDEGKARVKVLQSKDKWYGVTYKADKPLVVEAIAKLVQDGTYPSKLWG